MSVKLYWFLRLLCESEVEMHGWKEAFEEGIAEGLGDDTVCLATSPWETWK